MAKHLRVVIVATEANPADMLTTALGRAKVEQFCDETGQTAPHAETMDLKSKEVKKSKEAKIEAEAMTNGLMDANSRWMQTLD